VTATSRNDRVDIEDVLVRYAIGIDSRDWDLLRSCFTEDCDADYGDIGHWRSGDEITAWMAQTHDPMGPTMHRITNIVVAIDNDRVTARSYVHAILMTADRSTAIHAYGWYDDHLVCTSDGWRIAQRRFTSATIDVQPPAG
jgi:3-phenylpropionate/cinnamic acid dioxygenase small subunit